MLVPSGGGVVIVYNRGRQLPQRWHFSRATRMTRLGPSFKQTRSWLILAAACALGFSRVAEYAPIRAAEEPLAPPAAEDPPAAAPLLRKLLELFNGGGDLPPGNMETSEPESDAKDPIDARVPKDPQVDALWRAVAGAVERQEWATAVDVLQKLLDLPEDAVIERGTREWSSVRTAANRKIGQLPAAVRDDYAKRYGRLAERLLDEAQKFSDLSRLVDVATRYFHTPAGAAAAATLATRHFDQQEYAAATWWNRELLASNWPGVNDPRWRLQAAFAARQAQAEDVPLFLGELLQSPRPVVLGGRSVTPAEWWERSVLAPGGLPRPSEWRQFGGSLARIAVGSAGAPLLLPDWSQPLSTVPAIEERLRVLLQDLQDDRIPLIPAGSPIVLGDKLAFRDLRSVRVVNLFTGQPLWQTEEGVSPERIMNGIAVESVSEENSWRVRMNAQSFDQEYQGDSAEMHPLASWLFRDAANGFLSSDGERLYVLEDVAVMTRNQSGYTGDPDADASDPFGATWSSNRLSAYELATGRLAWTIGGPATVETATLPLAGAFFFGVPTADGDELYVVAAAGQEVRLQALDAATGRPRWSQLLAYADTKIELDIARRWLSAPVAIRDGILVCPTTVGWLIAIDRTRRCLLWAHRYWPRSEEEEFDPSLLFLPQLSLQESWSVGAPIIVGNQVLFAPPDAETLVCLNLLDGNERWQRPRDDGLYVAAVDEHRAVIVNQTSVAAVAVSSGKAAWTLNWSDELRPSGRGCVYGDEFAIPFNTGAVWLINLETGIVTEKLQTPPQMSPLGNLVKAGHRFVSLGPGGCQVFSERERFLEKLAQQRQKSPADPAAQLQGAEYEVLRGNYPSALELLSIEPAPNGAAELAERRRQVLWSTLTGLVEADPARSADYLERLAVMARDPAEEFRIEAARVAQLTASTDFLSAWERLWTCSSSRTGLETVVRPDDSDVAVDRTLWFSGRLQDIWEEADETLRANLDADVRKRIESALGGPIESWISLRQLLDFHPEVCRLRWALADRWGAAHLFARAEAELLPLANHPDRRVALETQLRLARLWQQFGLARDASQQLDRVLATPGAAEMELHSGLTVSDAVAAWRITSADSEPVSAANEVESHYRLETVRLAAVHAPQVQEIVPPPDVPYFEEWNLQLEPQEQRLGFQSRKTGEWTWLAPLRGLNRSADQGDSPYRILGHQAVVLHRDVLQVLSPVRQELVWSTAVGRGAESEYQAHRLPASTMIDTSSLDAEDGLLWAFREGQHRRMAACRPRAIVVVGRRTLEVYEPQTGRLRWSHANLPVNNMVFGTDEAVCVVDESAEKVMAYRTADGRPLTIPNLHKNVRQTLAIFDNDLIQLTTTPGLRLFHLASGKAQLRRRNLMTGADRWSTQLRPGSQVGKVGEEGILVIGPLGGVKTGRTVELLDFETGNRRKLDNLPFQRDVESFTPLVDRERFYLLVNHGDYGNYNYGDSLPSTRIHGMIYAWDRATGKLLWNRKISDQNLVLDRFEASPVLIFLARNWKQVGQATYTTLHLLALNKETGETLHESQTPSLFNGFHGVQIAEPEHAVELVSYNMRLRLTPSPPLAAPSRAIQP